MKTSFLYKNIFFGLALFVAGSLGLFSNANAHDSHYHHPSVGSDYYDYRGSAGRYNYHRYHNRHDRDHRYRDDDYRYSDYRFSRPYRKKQHCYRFRVKAIGGMGGFRFQHNIKNFKRFGREGYAGKICGHRWVEFELSKLDPGVKVVLKIDGKRFVYKPHSGHHRHINNWHRKYYSVRLGAQRGYGDY